MIELSRTVRFCLNDGPSLNRDAEHITNAFSAWPAMSGLGRYYELHVTCQGEADPETGYFLNIREIDAAVRQFALPQFQNAITCACHDINPTNHGCASVPMGTLLAKVITALQQPLHNTVTAIKLLLSPYYALVIWNENMNQVIIQQRYEFSAAHRLHVDTLSDEQNLNTFGKCNNPSGHGHNYEIEIDVAAEFNDDGGILDLATLDSVVNTSVIEKLDHKHLNLDVEAFKNLNPTVENIVRVIFDMLKDPINQLGCHLEQVSVWETGKTVCRYRG